MNIKYLVRASGGATPRLLGLASAALLCTGVAHAGCGSFNLAPSSGAAFRPAVYAVGSAPALLRVSNHEQAGIIGLWRFEMLAKSTSTNTNPMPDGTLVDFGYSEWHEDGTEIMNSGHQNPADSNFCMGAWKQTSASTFILKHLPLAWGNGTYTGPVVLKEWVKLDEDADAFSGTFSLSAYAAAELPGQEFSLDNRLVTITGTIKATRVTAD